MVNGHVLLTVQLFIQKFFLEKSGVSVTLIDDYAKVEAIQGKKASGIMLQNDTQLGYAPTIFEKLRGISLPIK